LEVPTRTISLLILEEAYITHNNHGVNIQENCSLHIQKALMAVGPTMLSDLLIINLALFRNHI
jgi:hypothetical protein